MTSPDPITDRDGRPAVVESEGDGRVRLRLPSGAAVDLPAALVHTGPDGARTVDVSFETLGAERAVLREVEERVTVDRTVRETGRVTARTVTETSLVPVDAAGWRDVVEVERVPVGRPVASVEGPRTEGDVTVVPVYEEVLVVSTQLVLREEVRLTRRREPTPSPPPVAVRRQRVEVDRSEPGA